MGLLQNSPNEKNEIDFPERGCLSHFLLEEEVFIDGTKIESLANRYTYHLPGAIFIIKRNTGEFFFASHSL